MGYRRYKSYRYRGHWVNPPSKFSQLEKLFGPAVWDIKLAFHDMDEDATNQLLSHYGGLYGDSAERYARKTMPKWKSRETKLSGQTMERLIELVPPYLSPDQRFKILKTIVSHTKPAPKREFIGIDVTDPSEGIQKIDSALQNIRVTDELADIPEKVMEAATWLYNDDATVARRLLVDIARAETEALKQSAEKEIGLLRRAILSGQIHDAGYKIKTPGGILEISAYTPKSNAGISSFDCFVASTCFGPDDHRTDVFRAWRDNTLKRYAIGRIFISWYYRNGSQLGSAIERSSILLKATRIILTEFAFFIEAMSHLTTRRDGNHE